MAESDLGTQLGMGVWAGWGRSAKALVGQLEAAASLDQVHKRVSSSWNPLSVLWGTEMSCHLGCGAVDSSRTSARGKGGPRQLQGECGSAAGRPCLWRCHVPRRSCGHWWGSLAAVGTGKGGPVANGLGVRGCSGGRRWGSGACV